MFICVATYIEIVTSELYFFKKPVIVFRVNNSSKGNDMNGRSIQPPTKLPGSDLNYDRVPRDIYKIWFEDKRLDQELISLATMPHPDWYQLKIAFEYPLNSIPNREKRINDRYFDVANKLAAVLQSEHCPQHFGFYLPIMDYPPAAECIIDALAQTTFKKNISLIGGAFMKESSVVALCKMLTKKNFEHIKVDLAHAKIDSDSGMNAIIDLLAHPNSPKWLNLDLTHAIPILPPPHSDSPFAWKILDDGLLNNNHCIELGIYCPNGDFLTIKTGRELANKRALEKKPILSVNNVNSFFHTSSFVHNRIDNDSIDLNSTLSTPKVQ